jgi:hypothetical protein
MQPTKVTSSEFQQAFGALSDKARHEPVITTERGRRSLVVMAGRMGRGRASCQGAGRIRAS